jgi:beta-glucosidase
VQNSKTQNGLLKTELGFRGFVVSDWYAQHTGLASAEAGMDMVMPGDFYWGKNQLATAVTNGSLNGTRLDDMATRVLAAWYRFAPLQTPGTNYTQGKDVSDPESAQVAFQAAVEGHVLVKNINSALPLSKPTSMSIFGWDAVGGINSSDAEIYSTSLQGTRKYTDGSDFSEIQYFLMSASVAPVGTTIPEVAFNGTLIVGGGSGGIHPVYTIAPYDALLSQALLDGTTLHTDLTSNQNPDVQDPNGPCLVLINSQSAEGADRATLADEYSDTLVTNVAAKCSNTIVVIHNAGTRLVDRWIDHPNITAAIFAHTPGQESGRALVELLYGRQSPSGRLPYTVAHDESDYGELLDPTVPTKEDPQYSQSNFTEGVFIDYRHFIKNNITPRFAFGYGLTYTTFEYSDLTISMTDGICRSLAPPDAAGDAVAPEGGLSSLYDVVATANITVTNTGSVEAAEVAQLYLNIPNSGVQRALRGFDKKWIEPGAAVEYSFPLRRRDLSIWDVEKQQWMMQSGDYEVVVGKSVLDVQLEDRFSLE